MFGKKKHDLDAELVDLLLAQPVPIAWSADVMIDRGPVDAPLLVHAYATCDLNNGGNYTDEVIETNALRWVADQMDAEPEACQVVHLTWSAKSLA